MYDHGLSKMEQCALMWKGKLTDVGKRILNSAFAGLLLPARHTNQSPITESAINSEQTSDEMAYLTGTW